MSDLKLDVDQAGELKAAFRRGKWSNADIKKLCEGNNPALVLKFLQGGCRFVRRDLSTLIVDRSVRIDVEKCMRSVLDGSVYSAFGGFTIAEEDPRALLLSKVDLSAVRFVDVFVDGEDVLEGEEMLQRVKRIPGVPLDAQSCLTLYHEEEQSTLRFIFDTFGVSNMEIVGTVFESRKGGHKSVLRLSRMEDDGSWYLGDHGLDYKRARDFVVPMLPVAQTL